MKCKILMLSECNHYVSLLQGLCMHRLQMAEHGWNCSLSHCGMCLASMQNEEGTRAWRGLPMM